MTPNSSSAAKVIFPAPALGGWLRAAGPALLYGIRLWAAVCLAQFAAFWLELDNSFWAGTSAAIVCQPVLGASLRKGWFRMVGTVTGAIAAVVLLNRTRLPGLRQSMDAGANASVLPAVSVASLVGFGAVIAALTAFATVRDWVLSIEGGPLVSLAVATNVLAALTGSASGGLTIALDALGHNYMTIASQAGINPALMHRVAVIGSGTLDILPHNGAVVTLLAICGCTHRESYLDIVIVGIVGAVLALVAVILLGTLFGSF